MAMTNSHESIEESDGLFRGVQDAHTHSRVSEKQWSGIMEGGTRIS